MGWCLSISAGILEDWYIYELSTHDNNARTKLRHGVKQIYYLVHGS